ncbi:hypothetical protein OsJ_05829 [Oryza sativa Japonica Group]|uniref:Glycosyltransferase n=1 Tax=Oryza sativa subsp. japonica TaxID=39947 RepID=A3A4C7_ORYSJ|nr:hypothetical protein OsJ_05829 [Oryza sativa Japonica Group]
MAAESTAQAPAQPHFVLAPLAAHGHLIPMVDLAGLLAAHGARASLVTTPLNATWLRGVAGKAAREKLPLEIVELPFSPAVAGLPPDYQSADKLSENEQFTPFVKAHARPRRALRGLLARSLGIPRLFFHGPSCFYSLCDLNAVVHGLHEQIAAAADADDEQETYVVPGMPVRVTVTKGTVPGFYNAPGCEALRDEAIEAMLAADGVVVNTFLDLEAQFVACYEAALGKPVWTLGPLCLHNRDDEAMASTDQRAITAWLDKQATCSVVYVGFGSVLRKLPKHLSEVGHGLEDSGKPFLWVVKESEASSRPEVQEWLDEFMARTATRGLVVRGWAPQVTILSHHAVGGFLTHCGWNSLLEAIARGVPVATWPHFADQFLNERLAVDVLGVGVPIGVTAPVSMLNEEYLTVDRGDVARVVSVLMDGGGEEAEERRRKAKEYGEQARRAMAKGGSSYENVMRLIARFTQTGVE